MSIGDIFKTMKRLLLKLDARSFDWVKESMIQYINWRAPGWVKEARDERERAQPINTKLTENSE